MVSIDCMKKSYNSETYQKMLAANGYVPGWMDPKDIQAYAMAYFKAALEFNGISPSHMRKPALDLTTDEKESFLTKFSVFEKKHHYGRYAWRRYRSASLCKSC